MFTYLVGLFARGTWKPTHRRPVTTDVNSGPAGVHVNIGHLTTGTLTYRC